MAKMVFIGHSRFSEKPASEPQTNNILPPMTLPLMMTQFIVHRTEPATEKLLSTPLGRNMPRGPGRGAENWVPSSLWPLTQRVTLGNSLRASLGLFPFLRAGWAEMI